MQLNPGFIRDLLLHICDGADLLWAMRGNFPLAMLAR